MPQSRGEGILGVGLLVEEKLIAKKRAETAARKIRATNFEMDDTLLEEFLKRLL
jgi:hypothetical protein